MKRTIKRIMLTILGMVSILNLYAQSNSSKYSLPELKVGDQCPDFKLDNIINWDRSKAKLSDFKGKIVILDFWATWCGPCISAMPKMDSLQKHFGDKIIILPVTYENVKTVKKFLGINTFVKGIKLPFLVADTTLGQYFRHNAIPHEVWIDQQGKVAMITKDSAVNKVNIERMLLGKGLDYVEQKKDILDFDSRKPLLISGAQNAIKPNQILYSTTFIRGKIKGIPSRNSFAATTANESRQACYNNYISKLYQAALIGPYSTSQKGIWDYKNIGLFQLNRVSWEARDSTLFNWIGQRKSDWDKVADSLKYFTFQVIAPVRDSALIQSYAVNELNRNFGSLLGIKGAVEKRRMKYLALIMMDNRGISKNLNAKKQFFIDIDQKKIQITNAGLDEFVFVWQSGSIPYNPIPIIDETGFKGLIDIDFNADPRSIEQVNEGLKKFGFQLIEKVGLIDMVVISDIQ